MNACDNGGGHVQHRRIFRKQGESAEESIREIQFFLVGKASLAQREKKISIRIREVVGNGEAKIIQLCGHVAPHVSVGRHLLR